MYFHCSLSVFLSVCLSVNKISAANEYTILDSVFAKWLLTYRTALDPIKISDLGLKVKISVTKNVCHNDDKKRTIFKSRRFQNQIPSSDWKFITFILIPKCITTKTREKC